jgi:F0F1-type ATP synthase assembly protein I
LEGTIANTKKPAWYSAAEASAIGIEMVVALGIGYWIGSRIDRRFHTSPWFTLFFLLAGAGAVIKSMVRIVRDYQREAASDDGASPSEGPDREPDGSDRP